MKWLKWSLVVVLGSIGLGYGAALGVPGGAHARETGEWFIGEAEQLWLGLFFVISFVVALPRSTRWASLALGGGYILALALGYWAGYHWGNFLGLHPD